MKRSMYLVFWILFAAAWLVLGHFARDTSSAAASPATAPAADQTVHTLNLPQLDPDLPQGPNRSIVLIRCGVCHTPHYILNQPAFPEKVWTAEVTKMRTTYGAPLEDTDVPKIIAYLMSVRGKSDK